MTQPADLSALPVHRVQRLEQNAFATYGQWFDPENRELVKTLELPWVNNAVGKSCIVPCRVLVTLTLSPRLGYVCPELHDVPDRSDIRSHIACLPCDLEGCIGVGLSFGYVEYPDHRPGGTGHGIIGSHPAFQHLMSVLPPTFWLDVINPAPTPPVLAQ